MSHVYLHMEEFFEYQKFTVHVQLTLSSSAIANAHGSAVVPAGQVAESTLTQIVNPS